MRSWSPQGGEGSEQHWKISSEIQTGVLWCSFLRSLSSRLAPRRSGNFSAVRGEKAYAQLSMSGFNTQETHFTFNFSVYSLLFQLELGHFFKMIITGLPFLITVKWRWMYHITAVATEINCSVTSLIAKSLLQGKMRQPQL